MISIHWHEIGTYLREQLGVPDMKPTILTFSLLTLAACAQSPNASSIRSSANDPDAFDVFVAGDKIECYDDVSNEVSTIKMTGPTSAYVKFQGGGETRFFPASQVSVSYESLHLDLRLTDAENRLERLMVSAQTVLGKGHGQYEDGGDSRGIDCSMKQRGSIKSYAQILHLNPEELAAWIQDPAAPELEISPVLAPLAKDARMASRMAKMKEQPIVSGIHLEVFRQGNVTTLYFEASADERAESSYYFVVDYDFAQKKVLNWSEVEFVDHP